MTIESQFTVSPIALLPGVERVAGEDNVHTMRPVMGYDDVAVFVKEFGGIYIVLGGQNVRFVEGGPPEAIDPSSPTGGFVANHPDRLTMVIVGTGQAERPVHNA